MPHGVAKKNVFFFFSFRISNYLQFWIRKNGKSCTSPLHSKRRNMLYRKEKEVGRDIINKESMAFHWLSPCQERRCIFSLSIVLSYYGRTWDLPLLVSRFYLIEVCIYYFLTFPPFDQDLFLKASLIKSQFFPVQWLFVLQCEEGTFVGVVSKRDTAQIRGKVHRFEAYWGHIWVTKSSRKDNSWVLLI